MWLKPRRPDKAQPPSGGVLNVAPDGADAYPAYSFPTDERLNRDIKL
ncbi:hypothetical protein [uncultured Kosakonia sp.]|nr:hypothetical protein [uncultured Kosakonia sp.]